MNRLSRWSRLKRGNTPETIDPTQASSVTPETTGDESPALDKDFLETGSCGNDVYEKQALEEQSLQEQPSIHQPDADTADDVGYSDNGSFDNDCLEDSLPEPESLAPGSDFSVYLQQGISQGMRRRALRRLFATGGYNVRDGLNDYDLDFRQQKPLSAEIAARLRQWTQPLEDALEQPETASLSTEQSVLEDNEMENDEQDNAAKPEEIAESPESIALQANPDSDNV